MAVIISDVKKFSACYLRGIRAGDKLISINGNEVFDVLDFDYYCTEDRLSLLFESKGKTKTVNLKSSNTGLIFETYLMDKKQHCKNKCVFCFVDQMPKGMRESLYFKDDDSRLSFLFGNYITLTGISEREVERVINLHISPINISVHTMNPELRVKMMGNPNAGKSLDIIRRFYEGKIDMNTQLVLCPGLNDGEELDFSLVSLAKYAPYVKSIAVVPVGMTKFRDGLFPLRPFSKEEAIDTIERVDRFNEKYGHFAYCADELYILAEKEMPNTDYYNDYVQLENGVGLWTSLKDEFLYSLENEVLKKSSEEKHIATGVAAYPLISELAETFNIKTGSEIIVHKIVNNFFGESVTVAGLLTATDIEEQLSGKISGELIINDCMLKTKEEPIFLDDVSVDELAEKMGVKITVTDGSGYDLLRKMMN
jgi:putative radical SAM enzyme (TIGR03279 family)